MKALAWSRDEFGYSDAQLAQNFSMDPVQVKLILMTHDEDEATKIETAAPSEQDAKDAARWRYGLTDPQGMAHLWRLLADGKGTAKSLDTMMDRIMKSRNDAAIKEGT